MADNLVGYSRAGDAFHYRWAARRCLKLIFPNSRLTQIVVEGSKDPGKDGEYVIDLAEYYRGDVKAARIEYYQLKHTTVQDKPFILSDLETTFSGFAKRFKAHLDSAGVLSEDIKFSIITNRKFDSSLKTNLSLLGSGGVVGTKFFNLITKYTALSKAQLEVFCTILTIEDSQGDYLVQREELRVEMAQLISGALEIPEVDTLIALVTERVLPESNGSIVKEDVLKRFGFTSERAIFPAESNWEPSKHSIERSLYPALLKKIITSKDQIVIHAPGGVGKSFFCRYVLNSMTEGSFAVAYDCFGAGKYRNRSETRHRHSDALVQIANELSAKGFCEPLISRGGSEKQLLQMFLSRIEKAIGALRKAYPASVLVILIDAADNAEMAAEEFGDYCFASELLKEKMPDGCHLAMLCRTERVQLLKPESYIKRVELTAFDDAESLMNLRLYFPVATELEGKEFHKLTFGNPRVQANSLFSNSTSVDLLFEKLGPGGTTVENQIAHQLQDAIDRVKNELTGNFQAQINAICTGLATLTPNIPIEVLSLAAGVPEETVKSFVSDIGRSLWVSETSVQFRDEPTETWFRSAFLPSNAEIENFINILEPIASKSTYVAEVLPQLYLQAEQYNKLIDVALSEHFLPENNPIDTRNVLIYRLHFAFKAALKMERISDAVKLAMRAGEEVAGDERQLSLLQSNIPLLVSLQSPEKVHEMAMRRLLGGRWDGSENIYSAALLSGITEFEGEARAFARSARAWIKIYFDNARNRQKHDRDEKISSGDVLEHAAMLLNLDGVKPCIDFLMGINPDERVSIIVKKLSIRLIDQGKISTVDELLRLSQSRPYYVLAIADALHDNGYLPEACSLDDCILRLSKSKTRITISTHSNDRHQVHEILSLLEVAVCHGIPAKKLLGILNAYVPERANGMVTNHHFTEDSQIFMRGLALRCHLKNVKEPLTEEILPSGVKLEDTSYDNQQKVSELKRVVNGILPWHLSRLEVLVSRKLPEKLIIDAKKASEKAASERYVHHDSLPRQIALVQLDILKFASKEKNLKGYYQKYIVANGSLYIDGMLKAVGLANRLPNLLSFKDELEIKTYQQVKELKDAGPDDLSEYYIALARAVLVNSKLDSSAYFEDAIEIVSKFGDEISYRWDALAELGTFAAKSQIANEKISYRFIRTAEVVGNNMREKHFGRGEAIKIAFGLSASSGIAALSRWRDRDIGDFPWLTISLMLAILEGRKMEPLKIWCLSTFCSVESFTRILDIFIKSSIVSTGEKQLILEDAINRLSREGIGLNQLAQIKNIATEHGVKTDSLRPDVNSTAVIEENEEPEITMDFVPDLPWLRLTKGTNIFTQEGILSVRSKIDRIKVKKKRHYSRGVYWIPFFKSLQSTDLLSFIELLLDADWLDNHDCAAFFKSIPNEWVSKRGFEKKYPEILKRLGRKYATELTDQYRLKSFSESLPVHEDVNKLLSQGIFQGLVDVKNVGDAESLFGFAKLAAAQVTPMEATELLDYGLSRMEIHIEDSFGEGNWSDWLKAPSDIDSSIALFLWSALGAPDSQTRWKAAHGLTKLAKLEQGEIILDIFQLWGTDQIGAFGSKKYPFYVLHARQYLLIAAVRISIEVPTLFLQNLDDIIGFAINTDHIVIQSLAAQLALNIEGLLPGSIAYEKRIELENVVKSPFDIVNDEMDSLRPSYRQLKGDIKQYKDFHFGYDFYRYWLGPLAEVFGISNEQVKDLAAEIIVEEWKGSDVGYEDDPRVEIWNKNSNSYATSHDHGSYPRTDNLDFYQSYHAMMIVASKLLKNMPVVVTSEYYSQPWRDWLDSHLLTRDDGFWISDWRDPVPEGKSFPPEYDTSIDWPGEILDADFHAGLFRLCNGERWINLKGWWKEVSGSRRQQYRVASALVSPETASALLITLSNIKNFHDFKLPDYDEKGFEYSIKPFILEGWLSSEDISKRLDEYDPFADQLMCPQYNIGTRFVDLLGLTSSADEKRYFNKGHEDYVCETESWASARHSRDEDPEKQGIRFSGSIDFLINLCLVTEQYLIIEVQVERDTYSRYSSRSERRQKSELHKIYLLSPDGKIRSTDEIIELREIADHSA